MDMPERTWAARSASGCQAAKVSADPATQRVPWSSAASPTASRVGPDPSSMTSPPEASSLVSGPERRGLWTTSGARRCGWLGSPTGGPAPGPPG
jgi:hypothetical protein